MDRLDQVGLVVCLTLIGVILINLMILSIIRRGKPWLEIELFRKTAQTARNPFQSDDQQLQELSRLVSELNRGDALTTNTEGTSDEQNHAPE